MVRGHFLFYLLKVKMPKCKKCIRGGAVSASETQIFIEQSYMKPSDRAKSVGS
jgi:hypothetical protein